MTIRHLNIFLAVAEYGTMSAAAEHLYLSQPFLLIEYLFGIYIGDFPPLVITLTNEYLCHKPGRGIFTYSFSLWNFSVFL